MIVPDSLCNDTLCLDTLEVASQDTLVDDLPHFYDYGFFASDTLFHAGVASHPYGFAATPVPFRLRHDGWSGLLLLVCLLLAASLVLRLRKKFRELLRGVFLPIPGKTDEPIVDDPLRYSTRLVAICLLSLTAAMVTFTYTQHDAVFYLFPETPYILFGAFFLLWIVYFLVKKMLTSFVNWIFFQSEKIFTWTRAYTFLYVAEAMLSLVLAVVVAYQPLSPDEVLVLSFCLIVLVKILLLFKTYQIFFPKMYGGLHLIVYFCTLEIMPLLVLWQVLTYSALLSTVKI